MEKKNSGKYNCAQAVICAYCDKCGIAEETAKNLGNSFAMGMGNTEGTCGALIGAGMVLGLLCKSPTESLKKMRRIMDRFAAEKGATRCCMLKGINNGKVLSSCSECVAHAVELLEEAVDE